MPDIGTGISAGISLIGQSRAKSAANAQAAAQEAAGRMGADASVLRPVGIKTGLGGTSFGYETLPSGVERLSSAEYTLDPRLRALQEQQFGMAPELLSGAYGLFGQQRGMVDPYAAQMAALSQQFLPTSAEYQMSPEAAQFAAQQRQLGSALFGPDFSLAPSADVLAQQQRLQGLAEQVTPTSYDPTAAAQQYYQEQQALLEPSRQQQEQRLAAGVFGRGRAGLNISGQGQPELYALGQAREQQNAQLAAAARERARTELGQDISLGTQLGAAGIQTGQQGMDYQLGRLGSGLQYLGGGLQTQTAAEDIARNRLLGNIQTGQGLFGSALTAQQVPYSTLASAYQPYNLAMGGITGIEDIGTGLLSTSTGLGGGSQAAGQALSSGFSAAANTRANAAQNQIAGLMGLGQGIINKFPSSTPWYSSGYTGAVNLPTATFGAFEV